MLPEIAAVLDLIPLKAHSAYPLFRMYIVARNTGKKVLGVSKGD
jgi:hypothetical protein